jgi:hypothetical protein
MRPYARATLASLRAVWAESIVALGEPAALFVLPERSLSGGGENRQETLPAWLATSGVRSATRGAKR